MINYLIRLLKIFRTAIQYCIKKFIFSTNFSKNEYDTFKEETNIAGHEGESDIFLNDKETPLFNIPKKLKDQTRHIEHQPHIFQFKHTYLAEQRLTKIEQKKHILFLSGLFSRAEVNAKYLKELAKESKANIYTFNYSGIGNSKGWARKIDDYVDLAKHMIYYMTIDPKGPKIDPTDLTIIGHSLGGLIASKAYLEHLKEQYNYIELSKQPEGYVYQGPRIKIICDRTFYRNDHCAAQSFSSMFTSAYVKGECYWLLENVAYWFYSSIDWLGVNKFFDMPWPKYMFSVISPKDQRYTNTEEDPTNKKRDDTVICHEPSLYNYAKKYQQALKEKVLKIVYGDKSHPFYQYFKSHKFTKKEENPKEAFDAHTTGFKELVNSYGKTAIEELTSIVHGIRAREVGEAIINRSRV